MEMDVKLNDCENVQLEGVAHVNIGKLVMFCPDNPVPGVVNPFVTNGKGQLMRDGTFDFSPLPPQKRRRGILLKKVAHGRLSATKDGAFLLTLKVFKHEGLNVAKVMSKEAKEAINEGFKL
ncbi:MAG: hypothetical protein SOZ58_06195 [Prevotella sp.]|nr:hypothetical protein [Prevotella sp.]